jgi:hypothetical protein
MARSPSFVAQLAECLIDPEANNSQAQWIYREFVVLHVFAENIGDGRCPALTLQFGVVDWIREHLLKLDARRIWRLAQVIQDDIFHFNVHKRKARISNIILDKVVLTLLVDHRALDVAVQIIERICLVPLDGEPVAAEVELGPARQVVFVLGFLRAVLKIAVVDSLCPADVIDAHYHRTHRCKRILAPVTHEAAHELLHRSERRTSTTKTVRETEAEAVAFIVGHAIGLEMGTTSSDYIQLYAGDASLLAESLEFIQATSAEILTALQPDSC